MKKIQKTRVHLNLDKGILDFIDSSARSEFMSRSAWVSKILRGMINLNLNAREEAKIVQGFSVKRKK